MLFIQLRREAGGWSVHGTGLTVRHQLRVYSTRRFAIETAVQWCGNRGEKLIDVGANPTRRGQVR